MNSNYSQTRRFPRLVVFVPREEIEISFVSLENAGTNVD